MMAPPTDRRSSVNRSLTPKRRNRVTENDEYAAFLTRALLASRFDERCRRPSTDKESGLVLVIHAARRPTSSAIARWSGQT
jgi:hypothetical protein